MSPSRPIFSSAYLTIALTLALNACAPHSPLPRTDTPSIEERLFDLEHRVEKIEARPDVAQPYRSREAIQADIKALEDERVKLLIRYTAQHPAIRDIDRRLTILNSQLKLQD